MLERVGFDPGTTTYKLNIVLKNATSVQWFHSYATIVNRLS